MAFLKVAKAVVQNPHVSRREWGKIRGAGVSLVAPSNIRTAGEKSTSNLVDQATGIFGVAFNPEGYLLTHATIVASVDVYAPDGMKTGSAFEGGFRVNRKFAEFRISAECQKFINNNRDAWSRPVLLKSFDTFIGGHNFVEHVQIEAMSKGRIIDAVARDIGDSVYVDILIATDRKHADLVKAIESGKMSTMSMGCFAPGTLITMADGRRVAIEDVQPGDMVLTHKGQAREVLNKQLQVGEWDMRTVHAVGLASPITSTGNHPYYVLRPAEVCACGCGESLPAYAPSVKKPTTRSLTRRFLRGHDKRILNPNNTYSREEFECRKAQMDEIQKPELVRVRADELRVGDFIAFPRVKDGEHTVETTEGKARLLGYFLAEGSFLKHKGKHCEVQFNFSLEEKDTFVREVVQLIGQEFPEANMPWVQERPERTTCAVHATGSDMVAWFLQHGGEYSHGKRLSADAMNWSQENHKHLIGAWVNGDGHQAKAHGGFLVGTTVSLDLASQMHALMAKCGWFARFEARIGAKSVTVAEAITGGAAVQDEATGRLPAYLLTIGNTQSVELQGYCAKAPVTAKYGNLNNRTFDDWVTSPIIAIEESTHYGDVHNMEVAEDHTYIAEGASVGNCTVDGTICTKCGHWAADETEMCPHIKYEKGNTFFDDQGRQHVVAELCGHESLDPSGGVTFIEASWVETPAFTGAVLRNVLEATPEVSKKVEQVLNTTPTQWGAGALQKAATTIDVLEQRMQITGSQVVGRVQHSPLTAPDVLSVRASVDPFLAGWEDEEEDEAPAEEAPAEEEKSPLQDVEKDLEQHVVDRVQKNIKKQLDDQDDIGDSMAPNDSLLQEASCQRVAAYTAGVDVLVRSASTDVAMVNALATFNSRLGVQIPVPMYRAALHVGALSQYMDSSSFHRACQAALGRQPSTSEVRVLTRLSRLLSRRVASIRGGTTRH